MKKNGNAKKTIIIILSIVIGLLIVLYLLINNLQIDSPNVDDSSHNDSGYLTANKDSISFKCSVIEPNVEKP